MRILLADDEPKVRSALRLLLEQELELDVVAEAGGAEEVLSAARASTPDLVFLDWELPGVQVAALVPTLLSIHPGLLVVALSGRPEARGPALAAGVNAFVSKGDPPERLLTALREVGVNRVL